MFTSMVWVALAGSSVSTTLPTVPAWQTDYQVAKKRGAEEKKPLAVVIGNGATGWESLSREGKLDPAVVELLQAQYVCVYIDATSQQGQKLADAFEMTQGVVLSDRQGERQAFRHEGQITGTDLERSLRQFADPNHTVIRTESLRHTEVRNYPTEVQTAPVYPSQFYAPIAPGFSPVGRGGC